MRWLSVPSSRWRRGAAGTIGDRRLQAISVLMAAAPARDDVISSLMHYLSLHHWLPIRACAFDIALIRRLLLTRCMIRDSKDASAALAPIAILA